MTILLENETERNIGLDYEEIAGTVAAAALDYLRCPYPAEINILLTDNPGIQSVNRRMRGIDGPTDVLSFPALEYVTPGDFSVVEQEIASSFNAATKELILGDILISLDKVVEQAEQYNHSPKREYAFLIAHSMLHLAGFDHMEEEERLHMEQMQEEILQSIGYTRDIK